MPRRMNDAELVELVMARFHPLINDPVAGVMPYSKLLENRFPGLDEPTLSRGIKEAFHRRLVELRPSEGVKPSERNAGLERDLRRTFGAGDADRLKTVIVLHFAPNVAIDADDIARAVGWSFGEWLMGSRVVGSKSVIGVGTGQTIYRVSEYVHERGAVPEDAIPAENVTLASLTGRLNARVRTKRNALADSDINAVRMGMGIAGQVNYRLIGLPALRPEENSERRSAPPSQLQLDYALVGFGPFDQIRRDLVALSRAQDPLRAQLKELHEIEEKLSGIRGGDRLPPFTPIGDVGGQLLAIDPPAGLKLTKQQQAHLESLPAKLTALSSRILTVDEQTLSRTRLWIVGGGVTKGHILRSILRSHVAGKGFVVDTLVTDSACAEAALEAESPSP
ncbi:MAG TPA: hypothetical protein VJN18_08060 [Polyangiaceae bacterium]|nr:hypothetical protein [Polyangiaceae bacterium]